MEKYRIKFSLWYDLLAKDEEEAVRIANDMFAEDAKEWIDPDKIQKLPNDAEVLNQEMSE